MSYRGKNDRNPGRPKLRTVPRHIYKRAEETINYLMEQDGYCPLTKRDFALIMAERYGQSWLKPADGTPDHRLVSEVCTLTREQEGDPVAASICAGYVVAYSTVHGGLVLVDPSGDMSYEHQVKFLAGDLQRQQQHKTENRRRCVIWEAATRNAAENKDIDLALLISNIKRDIEVTGFVSDSLVEEYGGALRERGLVG